LGEYNNLVLELTLPFQRPIHRNTIKAVIMLGLAVGLGPLSKSSTFKEEKMADMISIMNFLQFFTR